MYFIGKLCLALAFIAVVGCAVSPTAPDATAVPTLSAPAGSGNASVDRLMPRFAPPAQCAIEAIDLNVVVPSGLPTDRVSHTIEATFKGDSAGCPELVWTVFPPAPLVVSPKLHRATVYDNPENKMGQFDVTATMGTMRMSSTQRIAFPRTGR